MASVEKKAHVAAFAFPFTSHPVLLLNLIKQLSAVAPEIRFSFFSTQISNSKVFSAVNIRDYGNIKVYDIGDGIPDDYIPSGNPKEIIEFFINAAADNFRKRLEEVVEETGIKATCLLTDAFLWFSADIAESLRIPWLAFWPSGHPSLCLHMYTDAIHQRLMGESGKLQNVEERLDFIPGMSSIRASDLPREILYIDWSLSHLLYAMQSTLKRAALVLINSYDGIAPVVENDLRSKLQKLLNIGPFPLPEPAPTGEKDTSGCLSWLSHQRPASVVYVSFGTTLMPPMPELVALGEALEERRIPYLWSFRDDSKRQFLDGFFERTRSVGKVVQWAPQLQVLSHPSVGIFVTHCGWNSAFESILGGVPMICRPIFADQMIYGRFIQEVWRIGVGIDGGVFTKSSAMKALDWILVKEDGKRMKENIEKLKEGAFMAVAENGGSSRNFNSLTSLIVSSKN